MRDRLIELIESAKYEYVRQDRTKPCKYLADYIADHLLAEGVVVSPRKVGDTVYLPWEYDGIRSVASFTVLGIYVTGFGLQVATDFDTDDNGYADKYNNGVFEFADFGKTVFLTREEAEKALAERREG